MTHLLAQTTPPKASWTPQTAVLVAVGVGIVAAMILGAAAMYLRRRALDARTAEGGSILEGIDDMLRQGRITPEEHRAMRRSVAERAARRIDERRAAKAAAAPGGAGASVAPMRPRAAPPRPSAGPAREHPRTPAPAPPPPEDPPASLPGYDLPGPGPRS
jgi:uncharacterized protein with von Willebrand factor type A (vWA) domain